MDAKGSIVLEPLPEQAAPGCGFFQVIHPRERESQRRRGWVTEQDRVHFSR